MYGFARTEMLARRSPLVREARELAREVHKGEFREVGEMAFVDHPLTAAELLEAKDRDEELVAAGLLHDTLEYTPLELGEIRERFGVDVAAIVFALSEDEEIVGREERKLALRERVRDAGERAWTVFAADKTANVIALRGAYAEEGEDVERAMPVDLDMQILLWEADLEMLFEAVHGRESIALVDQFAEEMIGLWCQRFAAGIIGPLL